MPTPREPIYGDFSSRNTRNDGMRKSSESGFIRNNSEVADGSAGAHINRANDQKKKSCDFGKSIDKRKTFFQHADTSISIDSERFRSRGTVRRISVEKKKKTHLRHHNGVSEVSTSENDDEGGDISSGDVGENVEHEEAYKCDDSHRDIQDDDDDCMYTNMEQTYKEAGCVRCDDKNDHDAVNDDSVSKYKGKFAFRESKNYGHKCTGHDEGNRNDRIKKELKAKSAPKKVHPSNIITSVSYSLSPSKIHMNESRRFSKLLQSGYVPTNLKEFQHSHDKINRNDENEDYDGIVNQLEEDQEQYDSDDEEETNTVGNIPLWWYDDYDHIGYDKEGKKIYRTVEDDEIGKFLKKECPDNWRQIYDKKNNKIVHLTDTDVEIIRRIRQHSYPNHFFRDDQLYIESDMSDSIFPMKNTPEPKHRFVPSKWEAQKITKIVKSIRDGTFCRNQRKQLKKELEYEDHKDIWKNEIFSHQSCKYKSRLPNLIAPRMTLPTHEESYNPPEEYLLTEDEKKQWEKLSPEERTIHFIPRKYATLRHVGAYENLLIERFERCLDLYLCPRSLKSRMNVDPESLLPELPDPRDFRPFPTSISLLYAPIDNFKQLLPAMYSPVTSSNLNAISSALFQQSSTKPFPLTLSSYHFLRVFVKYGSISSCSFTPDGEYVAVSSIYRFINEDNGDTYNDGTTREGENMSEEDSGKIEQPNYFSLIYVFETYSGRIWNAYKFCGKINMISFHPFLPILAIACDHLLYLLGLDLCKHHVHCTSPVDILFLFSKSKPATPAKRKKTTQYQKKNSLLPAQNMISENRRKVVDMLSTYPLTNIDSQMREDEDNQLPSLQQPNSLEKKKQKEIDERKIKMRAQWKIVDHRESVYIQNLAAANDKKKYDKKENNQEYAYYDPANKRIIMKDEGHFEREETHRNVIKGSSGILGLVSVCHNSDVYQIHWHHKGTYIACVCPHSNVPSCQLYIHNIKTFKSITPFKKNSHGKIKCAKFHPKRPYIAVAYHKTIRIYNLQKSGSSNEENQSLVKILKGGEGISYFSIEKDGEHFAVCSENRRVYIYDTSISANVYKIVRIHDAAVYAAEFHQSLPLLLTSSRDGTIQIYHFKVFDNLLMNPLIVPLKRIKIHEETVRQKILFDTYLLDDSRKDHTKTRPIPQPLCCQWHPNQPWFVSGDSNGGCFMWS